LDETTRLITELRSNFASRSRHEESIENSRQQLSERSSHYQTAEELDLYSKQVVQEINNFLLHAEDILDSSEKTPGILRPQGEELKRQIEILEQKVEIANESSKSSKLRQKLINSQNKLSQLRDTIDFILTASRKETMRTPPTARIDTTDRQNLLHSTKKPVYSSPRNGTAIGLPPKSIAHTKKKSIEYEGIKKFNSENYKGTLL
jgi:chromosome segregation ATPase